jgi:hypothetical protein
MVDLFTLAIGPLHCELEIKNFRTSKSIGRLMFDIEFSQMEKVEV